MTVFMGIDFSMNSPAVCVGSPQAASDMKDCQFFAFHKEEAKLGNITLHKRTSVNGMSRCARNAMFVSGLVKEFNPKQIFLEGYSYGSTSSTLFQLAENGGILKYELYTLGYNPISIPPQTVKKLATGHGNCPKERMYEQWLKDTGVCLMTLLKQKENSNPLSDIVDSFYVLRAGLTLLQEP